MSVLWKSHFESLGAAFPEMLTGRKFVDVTLVCEGRRIHCHRVVLAASSTYFSDLFEENPAQHPIVILPRDVKFWSIQALVDFMYMGEVSVSESGFEELVKCAGMLHIRGFNKAITSQFLRKSSNNYCDVGETRAQSNYVDNQGAEHFDPLGLDHLNDMSDVINNFKIEMPESSQNSSFCPETLPIMLPGAPGRDDDVDPKPSSTLVQSGKRDWHSRMEQMDESQDQEESSNPDEVDSDYEETLLKSKIRRRNPTLKAQKRRLSESDNSMDADDGDTQGNMEQDSSNIPEFMQILPVAGPSTATSGSQNIQNERPINIQELRDFFVYELEENILETDLNERDMKELIRSTQRFITRHYGLYPSNVMKRSFAECVATIFPQINVDVLYDKETNKGLLDTRIRYMQKRHRMSGGQGRYNKEKIAKNLTAMERKEAASIAVALDQATAKKSVENIEFLQNASMKFQKERIMEAFRENFQHRQNNLKTVFQDYERIFRLCPDLLIQDFETKYGATPRAMEIWEDMDIEWNYSKLNPIKQSKVDLIIQKWCSPVARTLKFLSLFPPVSVDKSAKKPTLMTSVMQFIMFFPEGSTPAKIKADIDKVTSRPQLFAVGAHKKQISRYFIKIADKIFPAKADFHQSLDFYFKVHYSLNLKPDHPYFCRFMAKYVYKIDQSPMTLTKCCKIASDFNLI
ncbi:hypothetical protein DMENIID0001_041290 [Sergentomyia squamirostris]